VVQRYRNVSFFFFLLPGEFSGDPFVSASSCFVFAAFVDDIAVLRFVPTCYRFSFVLIAGELNF
jgi:hypothetical protein